MDVLNILAQYGILDIAVIIGIIGIMSKIRKQFLDLILESKIKQGWVRFLILAGLSLIFSIGLTAIVHLADFKWQVFLKMSWLNFIFSYVLHDTIKNLFFKET
jgi:hypothetical protein